MVGHPVPKTGAGYDYGEDLVGKGQKGGVPLDGAGMIAPLRFYLDPYRREPELIEVVDAADAREHIQNPVPWHPVILHHVQENIVQRLRKRSRVRWGQIRLRRSSRNFMIN